MARVTDRYMCLGCGRFWRSPSVELVSGKHFCPYCGDMYFTDNAQPNEPPPLYPEIDMDTPCMHKQTVELFGDVGFCTICGTRLEIIVGETLRQWQLDLLERLGI